MPNIPDIPGKDLISGVTKRTRRVVATAGAGALAAGGSVAKRVLRHAGGGDNGRAANADPIAETPTAPPGAEKKPTPKPKPVAIKPKAAKPKAAKPKPAKPKAAPKPKAKPGKPAKPDAGPAKPKVEPGKDPHRELNNPVVDDPDMTEYPDPYDTREDPRDPVDPDGAPFGEEPHPPTGAESTSEPPLSQDPENPDGGKPPRRENLDD